MHYMKIFNRKQWISLLHSTSLTLTKKEILSLKKINENISIKELTEIYLPLSHLLSLYINNNFNRQKILKNFFEIKEQYIPYIIGITGSVSVGKSTTARILKKLLSRWSAYYIIELVTTDGFLYPNQILKSKNLIQKKGFPESYDLCNLINFISQIKSGIPEITIPVYSHLIYDIIPRCYRVIFQPCILILEGLNILQKSNSYQDNNTSISNFIDFSIYIDAPEHTLKNWYINRFLTFRKNSLSYPNSYFYHYSNISEQESISTAYEIWIKINQPNLQQNIFPTRTWADLILNKNKNHEIEEIKLRRIP